MAYKLNEKLVFGIDLDYLAYVISILDKVDNNLNQPCLRKIFSNISTTYYLDGPMVGFFSLSRWNKTFTLPISGIELNYVI